MPPHSPPRPSVPWVLFVPWVLSLLLPSCTPAPAATWSWPDPLTATNAPPAHVLYSNLFAAADERYHILHGSNLVIQTEHITETIAVGSIVTNTIGTNTVVSTNYIQSLSTVTNLLSVTNINTLLAFDGTNGTITTPTYDMWSDLRQEIHSLADGSPLIWVAWWKTNTSGNFNSWHLTNGTIPPLIRDQVEIFNHKQIGLITDVVLNITTNQYGEYTSGDTLWTSGDPSPGPWILNEAHHVPGQSNNVIDFRTERLSWTVTNWHYSQTPQNVFDHNPLGQGFDPDGTTWPPWHLYHGNDAIRPLIRYIPAGTAAFANITFEITGTLWNWTNHNWTSYNTTQTVTMTTSADLALTQVWANVYHFWPLGEPANTGDIFRIMYTNALPTWSNTESPNYGPTLVEINEMIDYLQAMTHTYQSTYAFWKRMRTREISGTGTGATLAAAFAAAEANPTNIPQASYGNPSLNYLADNTIATGIRAGYTRDQYHIEITGSPYRSGTLQIYAKSGYGGSPVSQHDNFGGEGPTTNLASWLTGITLTSNGTYYTSVIGTTNIPPRPVMGAITGIVNRGYSAPGYAIIDYTTGTNAFRHP